MRVDAVVLGAGMIGVSCALHLQAKGKSVVLLDRREPGRETSFGNAGIIQREAIEPYGLPREFSFLLSRAANRGVDVRYHPSALVKLLGPLMSYYRNSGAKAHVLISQAYEAIIALSLDAHEKLIEQAGADGLQGSRGYFTLFRTEKELDKFFAVADRRARQGVHHVKLDKAAVKEAEPAIDGAFIGGVHWTDPVSIKDPGALVQAYARLFQQQGGKVVVGDATTLQRNCDAQWQVVTAGDAVILAPEVVVALGPWSVELTRRFGYTPPLFAKRGYHMHYAPRAGCVLQRAVIDAENGYVVAPMLAGLRLTTGAELALVNAPPTPRQLAAAEQIATRAFPLGARIDFAPWMGARPCMPDMKPVIGMVPGNDGMWCAFGHGHQGFTLGPITGELLAALMTGVKPRIDMEPFSPARNFG